MSRGEIRAFISDAETPKKPLAARSRRRAALSGRRPRAVAARAAAAHRRRVRPRLAARRRGGRARIAGQRGPLSGRNSSAEYSGTGRAIEAHPQQWGDVVLARKDVPTSYHLSVVVDDAAQGVSHVVRGRDLYEATVDPAAAAGIAGLRARPPISITTSSKGRTGASCRRARTTRVCSACARAARRRPTSGG